MLGHVWEKVDCESTLMAKEVLLPLAKRNPELFEPEPEARSGVVELLRKKKAVLSGAGDASVQQARSRTVRGSRAL